MANYTHTIEGLLAALIIVLLSEFSVNGQHRLPSYFGSRFGYRIDSRQGALTADADPSTQTTTPPPQPYTVYVNNQPIIAPPIVFMDVTTPTPEFLDCFGSCPTTSEYNPVCANNQQLYQNEQKFYCARRCGANIEIVRRGSCEGLFPMMRG